MYYLYPKKELSRSFDFQNHFPYPKFYYDFPLYQLSNTHLDAKLLEACRHESLNNSVGVSAVCRWCMFSGRDVIRDATYHET